MVGLWPISNHSGSDAAVLLGCGLVQNHSGRDAAVLLGLVLVKNQKQPSNQFSIRCPCPELRSGHCYCIDVAERLFSLDRAELLIALLLTRYDLFGSKSIPGSEAHL